MISDVVTTKKSLTVEEKKRVLRSAPKCLEIKLHQLKILCKLLFDLLSLVVWTINITQPYFVQEGEGKNFPIMTLTI